MLPAGRCECAGLPQLGPEAALFLLLHLSLVALPLQPFLPLLCPALGPLENTRGATTPSTSSSSIVAVRGRGGGR